MSKYGKAIVAAVIPIIGALVTYGILTGDQAQQIGLIATALVNIFGVWMVPNA